MSRPAIIIDDLGKSYRLGQKAEIYPTLRESLVNAVKAPLKRLRQLGEEGGEGESFWALRHVSAEIKPGEVVGIIGRNGAGKSTLLKILSRITEPTEGEVRLRGRVASLLEVGTGFHPELTGRENIYLNGSILGMKKVEIDRKFDEIVAFAEVERFLDTPVKRYSSGMYVRLAFAVAAHLDPEILVVDEVLAVGDAGFQKKCLGKMQDLSQGSGRTVLFVSHNISAVRSLCRSCCILERGRLVFQGPASDGIERYLASDDSDDLLASRMFTPPPDAVVHMKSAELTSGDGATSVLSTGDPLSVVVAFESSSPIRHPKVGFCIDSEAGFRVLNANNRYQASVDPAEPCTSGTVRCDLGPVPFMAGRYSVSLWFGTPQGDYHVEPNALTFEVIEQDIWGQGQTPPQHSSILWWPTRFEVQPAHS